MCWTQCEEGEDARSHLISKLTDTIGAVTVYRKAILTLW